MNQNHTPQGLAHAAADTIRELNLVTQSVSAFHGEHGFRGAALANLSGTVQGLTVMSQQPPGASP
ncbi:hypothetical protein [Streptomyces lavendofoliae]|uniref:hypothetical protein n=1 Tax=Streptomyces lavendofoliae TaxID=67314 RepID=UPI003D9463BE